MLVEQLIAQLDAFDPQVRREALEGLANHGALGPVGENVNMHFHSFFSYNAEGWSPSHIAYAARKAGLYAAGLCDFDVLDGLEEFLKAGELLGLRTAVNLETRAYLPEFAQVEISSPGEPGVIYIMGAGFARELPPASPQAQELAQYRTGARTRNLDLISRINERLPAVALDYEQDVLPLTPLGGATERHIMRAYVNKAEQVYGSAGVAQFWADLLGKSAVDIEKLLGTPVLEEAVRSKLAKRGGLGYVQPSESTFPPVDDFVAWVLSCRAIPMITWLDGTNEGEQDPRALLECLAAKGCAALNIIPDRNWNYQDPAVKAQKVANLEAVVQVADEMGLPINIGTEMNKAGLPFTDDLSGEVLSHFRDSFTQGAQVMVGHTILLRYADTSYVDDDGTVEERNSFFAQVGALPALTAPGAARLQSKGPERALEIVRKAVVEGRWPEA